MKRKRPIIGAVVFVVIVAILAAVFPPKRGIRADALRVLEIRVLVQQTNGPASGFVLITNCTHKQMLIQMPSILAKRDPSASEFNSHFVFAEIPSRVVIGPHSTTRWRLVFLSAPPPQPWRFRLKVAEEVRGVERTFLLANHSMRHFGEVLHGKVIGTGLITVGGTNYYQHPTEIIVGEDQDWPKMAGDQSGH